MACSLMASLVAEKNPKAVMKFYWIVNYLFICFYNKNFMLKVVFIL